MLHRGFAMPLHLRVEEGPSRGRDFVVPEAPPATVEIGRDVACAVWLPDERVSRRHARLEVTVDGVRLRNLSRWGTRLNEAPLEEGAALPIKPGDRILVGDTRLVVDTGPGDVVASCDSTRRVSQQAAEAVLRGTGPGSILEVLLAAARGPEGRPLGSWLPGLLTAAVGVAGGRRAAAFRALGVSAELVATDERSAADPGPALAPRDALDAARVEGPPVVITLDDDGAAVLCVVGPRAGLAPAALLVVHGGPADTAWWTALGLALAPHFDAPDPTEAETQPGRSPRRYAPRPARAATAQGGALVSRSAAMRRALERAARFARSDRPVLLRGESGTGKDRLARVLHEQSTRAQGAFVVVNAAGLDTALFESDLFGHVRGAFTSAVADRQGLLEQADGGTLFLDEVAELSPTSQAKLLRVLEDGTYRRLGETRERRADIRLISATAQPLERMVSESRFREDLYFRIATLVVPVPPLRERAEDLPDLVHELLRGLQRPDVQLAPDALSWLAKQRLPGNVRQLRGLLERAVLVSDGPVIEQATLAEELSLLALDAPPEDDEPTTLAGERATLDAVQRRHVERVLASVGNNRTRAAQVLGIDRSTLHDWLRRWGARES